MLVGQPTVMAIEMLLRADGLGERERAGVLALLGVGAAALPDRDAARALRAAADEGRTLLSPERTAQRLGVSRQTLYCWMANGTVKLRRAPMGRRRVGIYAEDVAAELAARVSGGTTAKETGEADDAKHM